MHIRLYKRHEKDCEHKDDKTYMRCGCSVWLAWGKTRKSAGTPIKERAQEKADAIKSSRVCEFSGDEQQLPVRYCRRIAGGHSYLRRLVCSDLLH